MTHTEFIRRSIILLTMIVVTVFVALAIWRLSSILLITFTCWVLSVGLNAIINRLRRLGLSRLAASVITIIGLIVVIGLIVAIVLPPFIVQIGNLIAGLDEAIENVIGQYEAFLNAETGNSLVRDVLPVFTVDDYRALLDGGQLGELINTQAGGAVNLTALAGSALPVLGGIGNFIGTLLVNLGIIILITGYLVADPMVYYRPLVALVPHHREWRVVDLLNKIQQAVIAWMGSLAISITFTSVSVTLVLGVILQVPNPIALGVLSGLGTLIPNLGYYIGLIPIIIFTAAADPSKVIPAAILYWLLNEFEGKFVSPRVIENELNIPPGVIIPFQLIAASVFGFFGILLAVPMLAIIIAIVKETYIFDTLGKRLRPSRIWQDENGQVMLEQTTPDASGETSETEPAAQLT